MVSGIQEETGGLTGTGRGPRKAAGPAFITILLRAP